MQKEGSCNSRSAVFFISTPSSVERVDILTDDDGLLPVDRRRTARRVLG